MEIQELIIQSFSQKLTLSQEKEVSKWLNSSEENKKTYIELQKLYTVLSMKEGYDKVAEKRILNNIKTIIRQDRKIKQTERIIASSVVAAAVLLFSFLLYHPEKKEVIDMRGFELVSLDSQLSRDSIVEAGQVKAYLTTTTGVIKIVEDKDIRIEKAETQKTEQKAVVYNTITVPPKSQFTVTLDDTTKVILNGGSSLTYPVAFTGEKREVLLSGEAYFDVKTDSLHPFVVMAKDVKSVVYGTKINVSAYKNQKQVTTTLFSGIVEVNGVKLHPGEMGQKKDLLSDVSVKRVDLNMISSWMRNEFYFDNSTLEDIIAQLSQWYGVNILYKDSSVRNERFTLLLSRTKDLNYALKLLSNTEKVEFKKLGEDIYVEKK